MTHSKRPKNTPKHAQGGPGWTRVDQGGPRVDQGWTKGGPTF